MIESNVLTRADVVQCGHEGIVHPLPDENAWEIDGVAILTARSFENAPIVGCALTESGGPFCTKVLKVIDGVSEILSPDLRPLLRDLNFITDGPYGKPLILANSPGTVVENRSALSPISLHGVSFLPARIRKLLGQVLESAGMRSALITSGRRTAEDQARVMYDNLQRHGSKHSRRLYRRSGQKVVSVYEHNATLPRDQVISKMAKKIHEIGPENVSAHCRQDRYVIDIAPSSVTNPAGFERAVRESPGVAKFLSPPTDPAYHIEFE